MNCFRQVSVADELLPRGKGGTTRESMLLRSRGPFVPKSAVMSASEEISSSL